MSRLALYLLGPPHIECDGAPIKLNRRKAIALLVYLAVTGESHRRDSLVNLLWPQYDGPRGRSVLRRTLYALRKALDGAWLEVDREQIGLTPLAGASPGTEQALWVDVTEFQRSLAGCETHGHPASEVCSACVAPLSDAVTLVRGDFLSGFSLKDSFNFDDWQLLQAEALRRELADALERLVRWHSTHLEFEPAVAFARRRLALDPLDESAHRQLMRLYAWSGQRSAALRQYEECRAALEEQLGVQPQENSTRLYHALQEGQVLPLPQPWEEQPEQIPPGRRLDPPATLPSFLEGKVAVEQPLFVARGRELADLGAFLDSTLAGKGRVVFVTGESGSGKTALIQAFSQQAQEMHPDLLVASGNCNAYTGIGDPYLPFREALGLLTGEVEARWAAGAITRDHAQRLWKTLPLAVQALVEAGPDLIDTFVSRAALIERAVTCAPLGADWLTRLDEIVERKPTALHTKGPQQSDLFEQYTRVLQILAQPGPLLLVVDDLQWADLGSISLLFHLGRHIEGSRILLVGAYRSEEVAIGREGERHPLEPVVNEFQRAFGSIMVDLNQAEGQDLISALLDSPASALAPNRLGPAFREMLHRQTRGHPLFTIELLRGLQERGDLVRDTEGRWAEGEALDWETLPARVEAVIAERIGRLDQPLQSALRVASVEGEVFTTEVLAQVVGTSDREMVQRLSQELDRQHRLVRAQAIERLGTQRVSRYRFRHNLFQRYLYDNLDQVERAYLHQDVGNALENLYEDRVGGIEARAGTGALAVQLAWHYEEAGITEKAIRYLHQAGDRAVQLSAYQEAVTHLTRGLALLMALPDPGDTERHAARDDQELSLQLTLGMASIGATGYGPEVERIYFRARELSQQLGRTPELCRSVGELSIVNYVQAEYQAARELAEEALSLAQQTKDPLLIVLGTWHLGFVLFALGEFATALAHLEQVLAFYDPQKHHRSLIALRGSDPGPSAMAYTACCLWCLGYPDQAARQSQKALDLARELDHPFTLIDVLCFGGCLFNTMRRDAQALDDCAREMKRLATEKVRGWLAQATRSRGEALAMTGHLEEGIAQMQDGLVFEQYGAERCFRSGCLCSLAEAQAKIGRPQEALATLAEALALVEESDERYWEAELHRVRGGLLLQQYREAEAEASFHQALEVARRQQAKSWELRATTDLARLWHKQDRTDEARHLLQQTDNWFTEGFDTADMREARALLEELW